jgi:hypothetical protein
MKLRSIHRLEVGDPDILGIRFTSDGVCLKLEYGYFAEDGRELTRAVRFFGVLGYTFESSRAVTSYTREPWTPDILNAIAEARDSPWIEQIEKIERSPWPFAKHHFLAYFGDVGLFEVIADRFEILPPRTGRVVGLAEEEPGWLPGDSP